MTRPKTYLLRMVGFLAAVLVMTLFLAGELAVAFASNPLLNAFIALVLIVGIAWNQIGRAHV